MKKKLLAFVVAVAAMIGVLAPAGNVYAASGYDCGHHFLGLRAWYDGLVKTDGAGNYKTKDGNCVIKSPEDLLKQNTTWNTVTEQSQSTHCAKRWTHSLNTQI